YFQGAATLHWTEYTYDKLGRVIQEKAPNNALTTVTYAGLETTSKNAKNQTRKETRNVQGQLVTVTDHYGKTLTRKYDALGNLEETVDALGNVTKLTYDLKGRKIQMIDPDMGTWVY